LRKPDKEGGMKVTTLRKPAAQRGGMSANAFGGHVRIDKLDLFGPSLVGGELLDVASNIRPERLLWVSTIRDAVRSYLIFGLGRNGTSAEEFWFAAEYLLNVRAAKPETWKDAPRTFAETYYDDQKRRRVTRTVQLTEDNIRAMCLDTAWDHLNFPLALGEFCARLMKERRRLLASNWAQVARFLALPGTPADWERALVCPETPEDVVELLEYCAARKAEVLQEAA
jgi:hypothetical protein